MFSTFSCFLSFSTTNQIKELFLIFSFVPLVPNTPRGALKHIAFVPKTGKRRAEKNGEVVLFDVTV